MAEPLIDLKPAYAILSRKLEMILRGQAPSKSIASQITVTYDAEGMYISMTRGYGTYLYRGTGDERAAGAMGGDEITQELLDALDGNNPDPNPGKGVGGIKPRYFLNFTDSVKAMIGDELSTAYAEAINEIIAQELEEL